MSTDHAMSMQEHFVIIRPHRSTTYVTSYVDTTYYYRQSIASSVCRSDCHHREPCKKRHPVNTIEPFMYFNHLFTMRNEHMHDSERDSDVSLWIQTRLLGWTPLQYTSNCRLMCSWEGSSQFRPSPLGGATTAGKPQRVDE